MDTEVYAKWLAFAGINAIDYSAGLDKETRKAIEHGLMANQWKCIVSTNALGMGIDKPDIRFIIHTQIPASPIHYYQEIGRAGRDGEPTKIILFYNETKDSQGIAADYRLPLSFIENARPTVNKYYKVIDLLLEEPLTEREVVKRANLKSTQVRVIKADLIEQGIIKEALYGKLKKYEYQYNAPKLDTSKFEELRRAKIADLDKMVGYVYTDMPRMKYLCGFLDSDEPVLYSNCDNTNLPRLFVEQNSVLVEKIEEFRETFFPVLELAESTTKPRSGWKIRIPKPDIIEVINAEGVINTHKGQIRFEGYEENARVIIQEVWEKHLEKASHIVDGYAASYYGVSNVGSAIHRSKYENGGDFPDFLLKRILSMFGKKYRGIHIDLVLYVPPTHSGDLVKNFAVKFASVIRTPISHGLIKIRETREQKIFQNAYSKRDNVAGAFDIEEKTVKNKTIVLIDDIYDSGATLKEVGKLLTQRGAKYIVPIVIAKTVGGTI